MRLLIISLINSKFCLSSWDTATYWLKNAHFYLRELA